MFPYPIPVLPLPIGYAAESSIPYKQALIRNHYVGRTFIEPSQAIRDFGVKLKLNPVRHLLEGKRVILVDDSIVRGTTSRKIVRMVRNAGAKEVHLRISCPPTVSPCYYGVDTPSLRELIAANNSIKEIEEFVEADSLAYLALDSLSDAVHDRTGKFCYACYTGHYPTLIQIDTTRSSARWVRSPGWRRGGTQGVSGPVAAACCVPSVACESRQLIFSCRGSNPETNRCNASRSNPSRHFAIVEAIGTKKNRPRERESPLPALKQARLESVPVSWWSFAKNIR